MFSEPKLVTGTLIGLSWASNMVMDAKSAAMAPLSLTAESGEASRQLDGQQPKRARELGDSDNVGASRKKRKGKK